MKFNFKEMETLLNAAKSRKEQIEGYYTEYIDGKYVFDREKIGETDEKTYIALENIINKIEKSEC